MKIKKIDDFIKGWFVGDFERALIRTKDFEVAVKYYKKGDTDEVHYHKVADEITVVVYGKCKINDKEYGPGDVIWLEPNDISRFEALEDSANVVVKKPSVMGDKYIVEE